MRLSELDDIEKEVLLGGVVERVRADLNDGRPLTEMEVKLKTVYVLRVRQSDDLPWSEPTYYRRRKERDDAERMNRCMGGIRTHAYKEKKTPEEIDELCY